MAEGEDVACFVDSLQRFYCERNTKVLCLARCATIKQRRKGLFHLRVPADSQKGVISTNLPAMSGFRQVPICAAGFQLKQALTTGLPPQQVKPASQANFWSKQEGFSAYKILASLF